MASPNIVPHEDWLAARLALLAAEKEFTHQRDALTRRRMAMPWERVEKPYRFETPDGARTLAALFDGRSQLIVYHFMLGADWEEGCKSCSFWADTFANIPIHLAHRDVTFTAVSRAPLAKIEAYKRRMGWSFPWASCHGSDFNVDYQASLTPEQIAAGQATYNYKLQPLKVSEQPGVSVFAKDDRGDVFHTYSSFARGLETFLGVYTLLDIVPKGRDEGALSYGMEWVRHHDRYGDAAFVDPYVKLKTAGD